MSLGQADFSGAIKIRTDPINQVYFPIFIDRVALANREIMHLVASVRPSVHLFVSLSVKVTGWVKVKCQISVFRGRILHTNSADAINRLLI